MLKILIGLLWLLENTRGLLLNQFSIEEIESKEFFLKGPDFIDQTVNNVHRAIAS